MKTIKIFIFLGAFFLGVLANAKPPGEYTWNDLKASDEVVDWNGRALFCNANKGKPACVEATSVPPGMDCVSVHSVKVPGPWIDLGTVPGVTAIQGDGKEKCGTRTIPQGAWMGVVDK